MKHQETTFKDGAEKRRKIRKRTIHSLLSQEQGKKGRRERRKSKKEWKRLLKRRELVTFDC